MDGWLVGLFTLLGVFVGGFFTFLGLKAQFKHQKDFNETEWRRKVRSEPLLKLRNELALIATELEMLVINTRSQHYRTDISNDEKNIELKQFIKKLKVYLENIDFLKTLKLQYDKELLHSMDEIESKYRLLFEYALDYDSLHRDLLKEFSTLSQEIETKIPEVQEMINKKLEEL